MMRRSGSIVRRSPPVTRRSAPAGRVTRGPVRPRTRCCCRRGR
jgi:hypothetical protein